ncbi:valine--tRNA ligase [Thermonema rossianum]|uniref:valine--tRNA ligase n=1 Tax=Thermonema rossianum TaxID=55505 RepID=UPI00056FDEAE|nr:valine--tRNA ligase [Thermonema rossianum]
MELAKKYNPAEVEDKWYRYWLENKVFSAKPNPEKEPYCIVIPPPNVTGVLHMGHMLNNTIQDVLIRRARMQGKEACWVPGTDHASIATEAKVVRMLRERGISKHELSREEFLKYAWEWKEKYGGIILEQLKKLGASCDWDRTRFTMDDKYYKAVIRVFVDLYKKGYIYRGLRMINWDPEAKTALSNEEVIYKEEGEISKLYHVRYPLADGSGHVVIATTRPETILADTAIAVNPNDERYAALVGKQALVPFVNRPIPIIADDYVDTSFGTGCLKVTPAHDPNDYEIGLRHQLEVIDILNEDGSLNEACGVEKYVGKDRFEVRKMIAKDLEEAGLLVKVEEITNKVGRSERTGAVVEPRLSLQWFIKMKEISKRALEAVEKDEVQLVPAKFKNIYRHWMENVRDWCISRQLWWGHRIPAYYYGEGENDFVVAETIEEAVALAREKSGNPHLQASDLRQDEDVLDTWASSWLWPIAVFDGFEDEYFDKEKGKIHKEKNADLNYFYPTKVLVTAPEILFFWVARMIIAGYEYLDERPFEHVYLTGIVRDKLGRKMSKSLGNSPDPLELMAQYGADGVRVGMLFSSPAGNDLLFDEKLCEQGRNFANKIWNAFRLVKGWTVEAGAAMPARNRLATDWLRARLETVKQALDEQFAQYRLSEALMTLYKFIWDDFCSWYLEMVKPAFGQPIDAPTYEQTTAFFDEILRLLHPFMPFITEELWQHLSERRNGETICQAPYPQVQAAADTGLIEEMERMMELIAQVRNVRAERQIPNKDSLPLFIKTNRQALYERYAEIVKKMANLAEIAFGEPAEGQNAIPFVLKEDECFLVVEGSVDTEQLKADLLKELDYYRGFKQSVEKKLSNERFVQNAPAAVVEKERKKLADAEAKIAAIEESLAKLGHAIDK